MKNIIFLLIFFSILLQGSAIAADNFYIGTPEVVKSNIFAEEVATYNVTITNFLSTEDNYAISGTSTDWIVIPSGVSVAADSSKTFILQIKPSSGVGLGVYGVETKFRSARTTESEKKLFLVNIRPFDPVFGMYRPSVALGVNIEKEVDPRKSIAVEVYLRNRNALDIESMTVVIDGTLFSETHTTPLGPLEEKREEFLFKIDDFQEPGIYPLSVQLIIKNITINQVSKNYEVMGYSTPTIDRDETTKFFKTTITVTLANIGNIEKTKQVKFKLPAYKGLFTSSEPKADVVKEKGERYLAWDITMQPQETIRIIIIQNYRLPMFIVLLVIVGIILYFVLRSPLIVIKDAFIEGSTKDGVSELKIRLFVKNRSRKNIRGAKLIDRIPGIADLKREKHLGTLYPSKIAKHAHKGTVLRWDLENLEPFEERIVTYEIKSRLKIIGAVSLPRAKLTFPDNGKERTTSSNDVVV